MSAPPESAHGSPDPAMKTQVWVVKTEEDKDAVIVSFVDPEAGEVEGIYLYEPGADPVEFDSVSMTGYATGDEWATVDTFRYTEQRLENGDRATEEREWPGDEYVSAASRDAAVDEAVEEHDTLSAEHDRMLAYVQRLRDATRRAHDVDGAAHGHHGAFQWCQHSVCRAAQDDVPGALA